MTSASNAGGHGTENFSYAGPTQDQVLSDGSATGITYGLAGQDGQPWVQSYTPAGTAADYVIHDQQGTPLGYIQSGSSYGFATDNLGSVTHIVNTCGCVAATYTYDPYGNITTKTGTNAADNLIGYTGQLADTGTGAATLYTHDGNRWYSPNTGNFTTQDTNSYLSNPQNGNRYAYAADNPANYTDPTGHQGQDTCSQVATLSECSVPSIVYGNNDVNASCGQNAFAIAATIGGVIVAWPIGVISGTIAVAGASTSISGVVESC